MQDKRWKAKWIEYNPAPLTVNPLNKNNAQVFYTSFDLSRVPKKATVDICGLGFYCLKINKKNVSEELLNPAFSAYDKTVFYNTYDIAGYLKAGANSIEIEIGNGWFFETKKSPWEFEHATWHTRPQMICELFADGKLILKSDSGWICGKSKTVFNSLRYGETYDSTADTGEHISANIAHGPGGILKPQNCPPIKLFDVIEPVNVINGNVYDFGKNIAGNIEITVKGNRGDEVNIQYSERIDENGNVNYEKLLPDPKLDRFQCDIYILSGEGKETWHSKFGYNGFRYAQIKSDAEIISVKARNFHTALEKAGDFKCDNAFVNQLQNAVVHTTLCNYHHIPTDCPHREKNGWTGDAHLSSEQALFNLDMKSAYLKWLDDIADCQRPNGAIPCIAPTSIWGYNWGSGNAWDVALFEIPWQMYLFYGDKSILKRYLPNMKKYISFLESTSDNGVWRTGLGDWCAPKNTATVSIEAVLTAYAYRIFYLYYRITEVLKDENGKYALNAANKVRKTFISVFEEKEPDSQTLLILQLQFGLTDKPERIFKRLIKQIEQSDYHINCGIFGVKYMFNILSEYGRHDIAFKILDKEDYPGYKNMLSIGGGTLCEDWECSSSLNHHIFASIGDWFYKSIAGINIDEKKPGFKNVIIKPNVCELCKEFKAWHNTPHGKLEVSIKNSKLFVTLPENCTADIILNGAKKHITSSQTVDII